MLARPVMGTSFLVTQEVKLCCCFSRLSLSIYFLFSSVTEALFALSFSFLSELFFFARAKAALAYSCNE